MGRRLILFALSFGLPLWPCDRPSLTMGRYIQSAEAIAIVDVASDVSAGSITVTFRDYLKGNSRGTPTTATLPCQGCPYVPDGKELAILLSPGWHSSQWPVIEIYTAPNDITDLRVLAKIYALDTERARLDALRPLATPDHPRYRDQLLDDLRNMREPANYPILTNLYQDFDKAGRAKVIDLIGYIGDVRGVPVLLEALQSGNQDTSDAARFVLKTHFPKAPGVSEALRLNPGRPVQESEMQRAFRLFKEGAKSEAAPLLKKVAADEHEYPEIRMWAALDLIGQLDAAGKSALRTAIWPLLARMAEDGNYLQIADAARILRGLPHAGNLPLLLQLLGRKEFVGQPTPYLAAMAIRESAPAVRTRATAALIDQLEAEAKQQKYRTVGGAPPASLVALAWIGGVPEFQRAIPIRGDYLRSVWGAGLQKDEGAFLLQALRNPGSLPTEAIDWIVMRLGELKDRRATATLFQQLQKPAWPVTDRTQEALIRIGGLQVETSAKALLAGPGSTPVREAGLKILYELKGPASLPYLRQAITDHALRTTALLLLGNVGTPQDLGVLLPMSDFWTGDRESHYWAMLAIAEIRARNP